MWGTGSQAGINRRQSEHAADLRVCENVCCGGGAGVGPYSRAEMRGYVFPRSAGDVLWAAAPGPVRKRYLLRLRRRDDPELSAAESRNMWIQLASRTVISTLAGRARTLIRHVSARSHPAVRFVHDTYQETLCGDYFGKPPRRSAARRAAIDVARVCPMAPDARPRHPLPRESQRELLRPP